METREETRTPRPVAGVDARALPIGPEEAYVLSRVDGATSEADIVAATGLDPVSVSHSLERLAELGAIRFESGSAEPPPRPVIPRAAAQPSAKLTRPVLEAYGADGIDASHPAAALYDPSELDEDVDIDLPKKRQILDFFYRLDSLNHYELLTVDPVADKKAVKTAYFEVVTVFHPDRYFNKKLGSFKPKLEKIFSRVTEAHDVLTRKNSRDEYDAYLATQRRTRDMDRLLVDERNHAVEIERVRRQIEEEARLAERVVQSTPPPRPLDDDARRKVLARKLGRSLQPPRAATSQQSIPLITPEALRERVTDDLKRRYDERVSFAKQQQVRRYIDAAEEALRQNNPVSAANALRIASTLAPEDATIAERLETVQHRASAELSDNYYDQAQYEERSGRFVEAARSYEKATIGKPLPRVFERAAFCLLQAQGDLRIAGEHARRAVAMAPNEAAYRVTLARVYLAAGMKTSAEGEFARAQQLAPDDDTIKDWLRRLKRGEI
jgi:tetratricopeptide (TPR) repeat protein